VLEVDAAVRDNLDALRASAGPRFIHALTYRLTGHTAVDAASYRDSAEVETRWQRDPIARAAAMLADVGIPAADLDGVKVEAAREMHGVLDAARASPWPDGRHTHSDVQDTPGQGLPTGGTR
jgi:pyruvate dehydrogenase E1 component alpha subunit